MLVSADTRQAGIGIALHLPGSFSAGVWVAGVILLVFAAVGYVEMRRAA